MFKIFSLYLTLFTYSSGQNCGNECMYLMPFKTILREKFDNFNFFSFQGIGLPGRKGVGGTPGSKSILNKLFLHMHMHICICINIYV